MDPKDFDLFRCAANAKPLVIFDLANNHQGSVAHGLAIVQGIGTVAQAFTADFQFAFKFQYRHLATFIHPDFRHRLDIPYVKRFSETALSENDFLALKKAVQDLGFLTICTPFDEPSVDAVERHGFDLIKIASCSFTDWPLLERMVKTDKPIIASTAAATLTEMDRVVSFLQHRNKFFALMHCVGEYPTPPDHLQLNQIDLLQQRYPEVVVGFSTHEEPSNVSAIALAVAKGARIFEKHVAVRSETLAPNAYSATPEQVRPWLEAGVQALRQGGEVGRRPESSAKEISDLRRFRRGVFARRRIARGEMVDGNNTFLAFPNQEGQLVANDLSKYTEVRASLDVEERQPITAVDKVDTRENVHAIVLRVRKMLAQANIAVSNQLEFEISHHYGLEQFSKVGATIITCVNRQYTKKLIVLIPGQRHPTHYHRQKEETFHVLFGDVSITVGEHERRYQPGDVVTITPGARHSFSSVGGGIFEEISSTHFRDDSFYDDPAIMANAQRKTQLTYWVE